MLSLIGKNMLCRLQSEGRMLNLDDLVKINLEVTKMLHSEYARRKIEGLKEL